MKTAILIGVVVAVALVGDVLLNNGKGARAVQRSVFHAITSLVE